MKKVLSLLLSFVMLFLLCAPRPSVIAQTEEKINKYSWGAIDANGYRIVAKGKQIGLGPATGVYDTITDYYWTSSNSNVMSIVGDNEKANCIVSANSDGTCIVDCTTISVYYLNGTLWDTAVDHNEHKFRVASYIKSLKFNKSKLAMKVGSSKQLAITTTPNSIYNQYVSGVSYKSSNEKVVKVDENGKAKALGTGKATITVFTDNGLKSYCEITVTKPKLKSIKLNKTDVVIEQGRKQTLKVKFSPKGAAQKVKWTSSNVKVAKVTSNGVVTAKKAGKATITARVSSSIFTKCKVTVPTKPKSIKLNKSKITLEKNKTFNLKYSFTPKKAYSKVSFSSSNTTVATVNQKGKIVAKSKGVAQIKVKTLSGKQAICTVMVKNPGATSVTLDKTKITLSVGESDRIYEAILPSTTTDKITWSSTNTSVATVDDGNIKAVGVGTATIIAKADSGVSGKCVVEVNDLPLDPNKYLDIYSKSDKQQYRTSKTFYAVDYLGIGFTIYTADASVYTWYNVNPSGWNSDYKYYYSDMQEDIIFNDIQAGEEYSFKIFYQEFWNMDGAEFSFYILYDDVKYKATGCGSYFSFEAV